MKSSAQSLVTSILEIANIKINGSNPWDIQVHNPQFYTRVIRDGELGLGESYMDKWWDCERLDIFIEKLLDANIENKVKTNFRFLMRAWLTKIINFQTKKRALEVGKKHYDLGNELFIHMLDNHMNYTCGYWKNADDLNNAQLAKLKLACEKLMLKPGMRLLDIGCGFGSFAKYAATNYGVSVVGITISKEQYEFAKQQCAGLPIEIKFQDYRDVNEKFDRIASLGMFEHVGHSNYRTYIEMVHRCLKDKGLFLLHTIGSNTTVTAASNWISKYIFPNGMLPSIAQIGRSVENLFVMEDWHNFGTYYDKTLMAWHQKFNQHWDNIKEKFDDKFFRMWNYYLLSCAGCFRSRDMQLWQIIFSKKGLKEGYISPR